MNQEQYIEQIHKMLQRKDLPEGMLEYLHSLISGILRKWTGMDET
ncbi:hypothetical protein NDGK_02949 [Clostridiales bacterium CHKCI001]|nr:hypothetical protein NDGK_02949 [Clostridiales bacterium CHKCI001]